MGSVTIAATYGAGGSVVAPKVAERLGLPFVERAIPLDVARRISEPLQTALADDTDNTSGMRRLLRNVIASSGLLVGVTATPEELGVVPEIAQTEATLRRLADSGGAVILGRAAVFVLQGRPDVLHVRLDGDVTARRKQALALGHVEPAAVTREQERTDRARRAYIETFYPRAGRWEDPLHYDLVLDGTRISLDTCVDLIESAARDLFSRQR